MKDYIDDLYKAILDRLTGGMLFGTPIDLTDVKQVVVAAYLQGKSEELVENWRKIGAIINEL